MIIARENEKRDMYKKNLMLLNPWIKDILEKVDETVLWERIKVTYSPDGYPIGHYCEGDHSFQITGTDPWQEAGIWCDNVPIEGKGAVFMYGSGFGYHLSEVFKRKQAHTLVIVFEENLYLFAAMLHYFDMEAIISTQKIVFLVGDITDFSKAFDQLFFSIVFANCTVPALYFTPLAQRNWKEQYMKIHQYVFSQLGLYVFYIGNDHLDNLIGLHNLLANLKEILTNPYLSCLKDQYQNIPAFIIGNGPSLDKGLEDLKKIQDRGLIISTESAIIPLLRNGIKPHILTIIERTKYTYEYHFKNVDYPQDMALLCLGLVDRQVYPAFPGAKIPLFRRQEAINEWLNRFIGDGSALEAGANVSHLALELAVYLGADPIVFVGQDYAYGPEGVTHSKDALYLQEEGKRAREILEAKPVVYVEGNEEQQVASNQLWVDFKQGLEGKIATHSHKTIINATEGGAKIKGAQRQSLKQVIEGYCKDTIERPVHQLILDHRARLSVSERIPRLMALLESIESYARLFRSLSQRASKGKLTCRKMMVLSREQDQEKYRPILEGAYQNNIAAYQLFIKDDLVRCFCQQVIFIYYHLMNRQGLLDTPEKITEIFGIQHDFFQHLNVVCQSVSVHLEDAQANIRQLLEVLNTGGEGGQTENE
ncbi:motility associated factor glycosyltransferase family protein [Alkaliphilus crotonatoxidans]